MWRRPEITRLTLKNIEHLNTQLDPDGIQLQVFVIGSREDPDPIPVDALEEIGGYLVIEENRPMGKKWNAGWRAIGELHEHFDSVMQMGSDNLVSAEYIRRAVAARRDGADVVGITQAIYADYYTGECGLVTPGVPFGFGPGRMYSKLVISMMAWQPYNTGQNKRMERTIDGRLARLNARVELIPASFRLDGSMENHVTLVDLKTDVNIWSFRHAREGRRKKKQWADMPDNLVSLLYPELGILNERTKVG